MAVPLVRYRDTVPSLMRGNARAMSAQELSRTISFARIVLIVGLVFLHYQWYPNSEFSLYRRPHSDGYQVAAFINGFFVFFFFSVVPLLSMISGWLFFSFAGDPNADPRLALSGRIKRRFLSLYVPLIFWNVLFLAWFVLWFLADPSHRLLGELDIDFARAGVMDYVNAVFGITDAPVGFQFWFVRDLFVTVLVSPLLLLLLRWAPHLGVAVLGAVWLAGGDLWIFFRGDVPFFFYLGGLLRMRGAALEIGWRAAVVLCALYVALVALRTLVPYLIEMDTDLLLRGVLSAATRSMRLVGVVACWAVFQHAARTRIGAVVAGYGGLAFFLHAAHYPLLGEVRILLWDVIPERTDLWMLAHYAGSVGLTVGVGMSAGALLARWAPGWFALMNGGRTLG